MSTDISERAFESDFCSSLEQLGYERMEPADYDADRAIDRGRFMAFVRQANAETLDRSHALTGDPNGNQLIDRLLKERGQRGLVDLYRTGFVYLGSRLTLLYGPEQLAQGRRNRCAYLRQVHFASDAKYRSQTLDVALFVNGLPVATFELKNRHTGQSVQNAIAQYRLRRRAALTPLLATGCCAVHFALDDYECHFCTALDEERSRFMPFNQGRDGGGKGNPDNPGGYRTEYLWREVLEPGALAYVLTNLCYSPSSSRRVPVFPRWHQLRAVRRLEEATVQRAAEAQYLINPIPFDAQPSALGHRFLVQHSAGSGKSNTITWLAYRLSALRRPDKGALFSSIIVVTDRRNLNAQLTDNFRRFTSETGLVAQATSGEHLARLMRDGKRIILTTVQKFPFVLRQLHEADFASRDFALLIDEAHSSQSGRAAQSMSQAVAHKNKSDAPASSEEEDEMPEPENPEEPENDPEDRILAIIEQHRMASNANYYAFTATPKHKTLETFGERYVVEGAEGPEERHRPFDLYSMRQAIDEEFILDVLQYYLPFTSYYEVAKTSSDNPLFKSKRARKLLKRMVDGHSQTIAMKSSVIVSHFSEVVSPWLGGSARGMVVCAARRNAVAYAFAINRELARRGVPYRALVAFSGSLNNEDMGDTYQDVGEGDRDLRQYREFVSGHPDFDEAALNARFASELPGAPSGPLTDQALVDAFDHKTNRFRLLIVAGKYQTGFDQPKLMAMYVDKVLSDIKAVQTLSRLNRCLPGKDRTFVLDFCNEPDNIRKSFQPYYQSTELKGSTDVNDLTDLVRRMDALATPADSEGWPSSTVLLWPAVESVVQLYIGEEPRPSFEPLLGEAVSRFEALGSEEERAEFKTAAGQFVRLYNFLCAITPLTVPAWEKRNIFLLLLLPLLPGVEDEELADLLRRVDLVRYRQQRREELALRLESADGTLTPTSVRQAPRSDELAPLERIVEEFNAQFGGLFSSEATRAEGQDLVMGVLPRALSGNARIKKLIEQGDDDTLADVLAGEMGAWLSTHVGAAQELAQAVNADTDGLKGWLLARLPDLIRSRSWLHDNAGAMAQAAEGEAKYGKGERV